MGIRRPINGAYFVNSAISVAIMALFRLIPPLSVMTPSGMALLGIFIGLVWAWVTVDMIWPSILALTLVGACGLADGGVPGVLTAIAGNGVVQMLVCLLAFSAILTTSGISEQLARRLVGLRICQGHPWVLTICIYLASLICSALGSGFAVVLVCWDLVYGIAREVGYGRHDAWPRMAIIAVVIGSVHGLAGMPFQAAVVGAFGYLAAASGASVVSYDYLAFILFACVFFTVASTLYFLACRVILRPDLSKLREARPRAATEPFTARQRLALGLLAALFLYMIVPSLMPTGPVGEFLQGVGLTPFVLVLIGVAVMARGRDGQRLFDFGELAHAGLQWPMIFMVSTAVFMGISLSAEGTGFTETMVDLFSPLLAGTSVFAFCAMVVIVASVMTNVLSNAVTSAVVIPVMYPFAVALGINPIVPTVLVIHATEMGLLLPCSSPNGALLYGNQAWLDTRDVVGQSLVAIVTTAIALIICIYPAFALLG